MKKRMKVSFMAAVMAMTMLHPGIALAEDGMQNMQISERGVQTFAEATKETQPIKGTVRCTVKDGENENAVLLYKEQETKVMTLLVTNQTNQDLTNLRVTPSLAANTDGWPFEIVQQDYSQNVAVLSQGSSVEVPFTFTARSDVEKNYYKLVFYISSEELEAQEKTIYVKATPKQTPVQPETPQEVVVQEPSSEDVAPQSDSGMTYDAGGVANGEITSSGGNTDPASVPRVIVTGFTTNPSDVKAGSNFKLIIHVKNTSTKTAVSNMLFDLQAPSSGTEAAAEAPAFLPVSGSSSIFLDKIGAGETRDISMDMNARADLVQKPYSINLSMKYEDGNATQYEGTSSLAVPIKQPARFEISTLEISPESISVGEEASISASLYNTGRIKLYNVKIKFSGAGIEESEVFVGNVESGGTGAIDGMVKGKKVMPATSKCKMTISYEDDAGVVTTSEQEFALEVTAANEDVSAAVPEEVQKKGLPVLPIGLGLLVVIGGMVTFFIKRKGKKKSMEEEDLMDELDRFAEDEQQ